MKKNLMEFIGTMFLVLGISLTGNPMAIGLMLMSMVYLGGHISGAHYNPAVTLAIWIRGKISTRDGLGYMGFQVLGAFVASIIFCLLTNKTFIPEPQYALSFWKVLLVEIIFTFVLVFVVLTVATSEDLKGNFIYGIAIGAALMAIIYAGAELSGGVYNPAVAFGPMIFAFFWTGLSISNVCLYFFGPFAGGILAGVTFQFINKKESHTN